MGKGARSSDEREEKEGVQETVRGVGQRDGGRRKDQEERKSRYSNFALSVKIEVLSLSLISMITRAV